MPSVVWNLKHKDSDKWLFAWSPYNFKTMHEKHDLLEVVIIVSKATMQTKQFNYYEFKNQFIEI